MILESLITDDRKVTLDCTKSLITKGQSIDIPDSFWDNPEVRGAIKMGLVRLVGEMPVTPQSAIGPMDKKIKLRNIGKSTICLDCVRSSVIPGGTIEISSNFMNEKEIINALHWKLLEDVESPAVFSPTASNAPVDLEELTFNDVDMAINSSPSIDVAPKNSEPTKTKRGQRNAGTVKRTAKPITPVGSSQNSDGVSVGDIDFDRDSGNLFGDTQVVDRSTRRPNAAPTPAPASNPIPVDVDDSEGDGDGYSFADIFEGK